MVWRGGKCSKKCIPGCVLAVLSHDTSDTACTGTLPRTLLRDARPNYWLSFARSCIGFPPGSRRKLSWPSRSRGRALRRRVTRRWSSCLTTTLSWRRLRRTGRTARRGRAEAKNMEWLLRSLDRHVCRFFNFLFLAGGGDELSCCLFSSYSARWSWRLVFYAWYGTRAALCLCYTWYRFVFVGETGAIPL